MPLPHNHDSCSSFDQHSSKRTLFSIRTQVTIPLKGGILSEFIAFSDFPDGREHTALRLGAPPTDVPPLVRIHSECLTGDVFGSLRCDCGQQLKEALERISAEGGYVLYLRQEGRGIGLAAKLESYTLQDQGFDTYEANEYLKLPRDLRTYEAAAMMLKALGVYEVRLFTNNTTKVEGLRRNGVLVTEQIRTSIFVNMHNARYIAAKRQNSDHTFSCS